jgi:para-aminobenzoate synthetase/4-amino-4-deoxychorismate lyase
MKHWHPLPEEVYALVEQTPAAVLLEGGCRAAADAPWTRLFVAPLRVCEAYCADEIPKLFAEIENALAAGLCAAGFFSYECGSCFEPKAGQRASQQGQPLAWFGIYEREYIFDHRTGRFAAGEPPDLTRFRTAAPTAGSDASTEPKIRAKFSLSKDEYAQRIAAIHEWIRSGDVYQLNFTAPVKIEAEGSAAGLYARLRRRQPAPYGAFLHWRPGRRTLSFSPELFFRIDDDARRGGRRIVTRPMKGTAPRGRTIQEDRAIAKWLRNDLKNRSENVMIVDLVRNDLGRLAQTGSVRVNDLFAVERYPTLWQMTSTVSAELRPEVRLQEIFRALFPCGSVTGAPKVRAMQLIGKTEEAPRGVYTGAIGFFSPRQTVFNVAIRTLELEGSRGTMGTGGGIVIDSNAADEYRECLLKAEFLTRSAARIPAGFSLLETMLWNGGFPLLDLHLDRLADSAEYFDFPYDRAAVNSALEEHARHFADTAPRKIRLLLDAECGIKIEDEALPASDGQPRAIRVRVARERTDPADAMLYHKTTHRPLYAKAFAEALRDGFDDALFLNLRGEVTEGAISNIFVEKNGRWFTPPVECGLLDGVYRRHLRATRPEIEERVLTLDDLRSADAIYLTNAVRGLRKAEIDWPNY